MFFTQSVSNHILRDSIRTLCVSGVPALVAYRCGSACVVFVGLEIVDDDQLREVAFFRASLFERR